MFSSIQPTKIMINIVRSQILTEEKLREIAARAEADDEPEGPEEADLDREPPSDREEV
ncbi:MAG: hypothetical protein V4469_01145 [Patescibacteria group bacterium]